MTIAFSVVDLRKLRPAKVRSAVRRRLFERCVPGAVTLRPVRGGVTDIGSRTGGWSVPLELIEPGWKCWCVGAGGDVSFDLQLIEQRGVSVRSFDAVAEFARAAREQAGGEARLSAHHAAIALRDGPIRMQRSHDPVSSSLSAAGLYDTSSYVEQPGRTVVSLMSELGDDHIDLLKLDVEGAEYELLQGIDLAALGVQVLSVQLHHVGTIRQALGLIKGLSQSGYEPVACRPAVKLTFVRRELLAA